MFILLSDIFGALKEWRADVRDENKLRGLQFQMEDLNQKITASMVNFSDSHDRVDLTAMHNAQLELKMCSESNDEVLRRIEVREANRALRASRWFRRRHRRAVIH